MFHKHSIIFVLLLALLLSGCNGGSAPSLDSSAQAWVEYPYEGSTLPMAPLNFVVYAADPGGISYIHIKVNGESLPAYAASPMTVDGSARLVRIDYAWTPPGEGEYTVEAAGVNNAGAAGVFGATRFCIVTCQPASAPPTDTPAPGSSDTPVPGATDTPIPFITLPPLSPTPTFTLTSPPPAANVTVNFYADPPYVDAGNCSFLRWEVSGTDKVYLNGSLVPAVSNQQRCPCENETHTLRAIAPDGTAQDYYARIDVYGSCYAPHPTEPPTEPPPPSDTTGPSINAVYTFWDGCEIYGQADISDPSGVSWAEFHYNLNGDQGWIKMNESGGLWTSQVGLSVSDGMGTPVGSLVYKVRTLDTLNNESWSGEYTLNYMGCGGTQ